MLLSDYHVEAFLMKPIFVRFRNDLKIYSSQSPNSFCSKVPCFYLLSLFYLTSLATTMYFFHWYLFLDCSRYSQLPFLHCCRYRLRIECNDTLCETLCSFPKSLITPLESTLKSNTLKTISNIYSFFKIALIIDLINWNNPQAFVYIYHFIS